MVRAFRSTLRVAFVLAATVAVAIPAPALGHGAKAPRPSYATASVSYVASTGAIAGIKFAPLINSGETAFGTLFEGIPDGIGVAPVGGGGHWGWNGWGRSRYVDLYVNHEQSRVPFGGFADYFDSSVSRVRVDTWTRKIVDLDVAISADEGFIRFCSSFMAGPEQGFAHYTLLTNEESNDPLNVPAGAVYGPDPAYGGANVRQAGYSVMLDTRTGKLDVLENAGRHNHENQVVVPGWRKGIVSLSGDDTFTSPSTRERPNLSQLYMFRAKNAKAFQKDDGTLWAFRVTGTQSGPVDPANPANGANDYADIHVGDTFKGEFIPVDPAVARGDTAALPQDALEDWSNANNIFQFVRVEDIAYDPDHPRTIYFADTGNSRLIDPGTGRLYRAPSGTSGTLASLGRIFKMVLNAHDPRKVDSFSIVTESETIGMRNPDNVAVSHRSLMVQEDTSDAKIWRYDLSAGTWTHIATATQPTAETSGIVDVSKWFGRGWWALDVQSHINTATTPGQVYTGPGLSNGVTFTARREDGQLLLMYVPGS